MARFFPYGMFRPDGIIFRYVGVYTGTFCLLLLSPTLASLYKLRVHGLYVLCMPFLVKHIVYWNV
jgi:hypothetical protein